MGKDNGGGSKRLDELLGQGHLGGPTRDRIFEGALCDAGVGVRRRRVWFWVPTSLAGAAALLALTLRPTDPFQSRGGGPEPLLEVACRESAGRSCPVGGTLLFEVDGALEGGFLQAWAQRAAPAAERIWYFPGPDGSSPAVVARAERQVLPKGVRIGEAQPAGTWQIHLVLSRRPLTREESLAPPAAQVLSSTTLRFEVRP